MRGGRAKQNEGFGVGVSVSSASSPPPGGSSPSTNDLGGYSLMVAESKEALAELLKGHPHFMTPDGTIELVEIMPIPGM